jgi:universal stress protein E
MSWRHILFAVDPSSHIGPRVMRKLIHLARACDAEIELYQCAFEWGALRKGGIGSTVSDQEIRQVIEGRRGELDAVAQAVRERGVRARVTINCERPGHEAILRQVLNSKPDLLVVHSTRHSSLARLILSYSDFKLIEMCPCPLLLVKTEKSYLEPCIVAAVDPMHAHDKPAALDERIVETATMLAQAVGGTLHLFHARALWPEVFEPVDDVGASTEPRRAELVAAYVEKSDLRVRALARAAEIREDRIHLPWGDAVEQLPRFAHSTHADVVVMGAVARSGLQRVFVGHTAERVLDALDCDVLVVKPPGFHTPLAEWPQHGAAR